MSDKLLQNQKNLNSPEDRNDFIKRLKGFLPSDYQCLNTSFNEITIIASIYNYVEILKRLRDDNFFSFKQLTDITAVDYPKRENRFQLIYLLLSLNKNKRIKFVLNIKDGEIVPSVTHLFKSANWAEREIWDMFGIFFSNHPDLRRLLTDYGFEGHPLRKDFPLTGYTEVRYSQSNKQVIYEPVSLTQEFRNFDFESPWEGVDDIVKNEN